MSDTITIDPKLSPPNAGVVRLLMWALTLAAGLAASTAAYVWHREVGAREKVEDAQQTDHDVLIELRTDVHQIKDDVKTLIEHERTHHQ
jgi:hypothetical protein